MRQGAKTRHSTLQIASVAASKQLIEFTNVIQHIRLLFLRNFWQFFAPQFRP